ncbi:unnamed protein product [Ostreobium quekettii]|uniref:F-box domain-containing protein n=1 Tax=Ostreobium quekettii TaxID=121088 RepID=A0A8S1J3T2_9CHLO|nr:unnamed protein product [Ostreobium quekettii]|eukprot:evm.model.scf_1394.1 EVM.evm.TU.scf_1394.1   scf_1394:27121-35295(-)
MDAFQGQLFALHCATCAFIVYTLLSMDQPWLCLLVVLAESVLFALPKASVLQTELQQASVTVLLVLAVAARAWKEPHRRRARRRAAGATPQGTTDSASPASRKNADARASLPVAEAGNWVQMPKALMGQVLKHLTPLDLRSARLVCWHWSVSLAHAISRLQPSKFLPSIIVKDFPFLHELDLHNCTEDVDAQGLRYIQELQNLEVLDMGQDPMFLASTINDSCIAGLLGLSLLHTLNLTQCVHITDEGVGILVQLSSLTSLSISGCAAVTDAGMAQLSRLRGLRRLEVPWCLKISDAGILSLSHLTALEALNISGCQLVSEAGVCSLSAFTGLKSLNLVYTGVSMASVSDRALGRLCGLTGLLQLSLGCMQLRGTRVSDEGLKTIAKNHRGLTHLTLMWLNVGNEGVMALTSLSRLRVLVLRGCPRVTADGVAHLGGLPQLRDVNLLSNPWLDVTDGVLCDFAPLSGLRSLGLGDMHQANVLSDFGMELLAGFGGLTSLSLAYTMWEFAGDGLAPLLGLTALRSLDMQGCGSLNDATLRVVGRLSSLTSLQLSHCKKVTSRGAAHLTALTDVVILALGGCHRIDDAGLEAISSLTHIRTLVLSELLEITDAGLERLEGMVELQTLDLSGCEGLRGTGFCALGRVPLTSVSLGGCVGLADEGVAAFCRAEASTGLTKLDLCGCNLLTGDGAAALDVLTRLTGLDLSNCVWMGDAPLAVLCNLPRLATFKLSGCSRVTDSGIEMLTRLEGLLTMHLDRCPRITDVGLSNLGKCTSLTSLCLQRCINITDYGISHLTGLTRLCILNLALCPKVTAVGLALLRDLGAVACLEY